MKLVVIIGAGAVGKMTVGQELAKITELRLFHNHMAIEPVLELFGYFDGETVAEIRESIFRHFAASDNYCMIFTYMWAFDHRQDRDYIERVKSIFEPYGTEFYCVELIAPQHIRLERNATENRAKNKPSKANIEFSSKRIIHEDANYRLVSREGEIPFENYLRLDNSALSAEEAARIIKESFGL
ncbi:MAG: AAA family ATPase [Clostridia bacterium]|nr:AAA family ATPase [Clostridia bacterium]